MPSGDMRQTIIEHGTYAWPSTSGNAFAAVVLRRIMPIPENVYRGMPDIYLCHLSALFGQVISLEKPGGSTGCTERITTTGHAVQSRSILISIGGGPSSWLLVTSI